MLSAEALEFYSISKRDLNINTITDFLILAFSNNHVGNKDSVFTSMAVFLRQAGDIGLRLWLGWAPPRVPLLKT